MYYRYGLGKYWLENALFPLPPLEEQQAIAVFLDEQTAVLDNLISEKQALIGLLQEKRAAVISRAVTQGLNSAVVLKDSGVDWIGRIPAHWDVVKIRHLTQVKRGASPRPIDDPNYFNDEGEYSWVRIADVTASDRYLLETTQRLSELGKSKSVPLEPGDIFLSIAGSVGKPIITKIKCCIHDGFVYFPDLDIDREFLYYIFLSGQPYQGLGKLGTQLNLNTDTVGDIKLPIPPKHEQNEIVGNLDQRTERLDKLISETEASIATLQEYRTALIANTVTGQIDVRQALIHP